MIPSPTPPSTGAPAPAGAARPSLPATPRGRRLCVLAGILLLVYSYVMAVFVPVPYILLEPGSADNVIPLLSVSGAPRYPPQGQLLFLTVSLSERITPFEAVRAYLDDAIDVVPEEVFTGGKPREEVRRLNRRLMERSKRTAIAVALERLGHDVETVRRGALVTAVVHGLPAAGRVQPGDVIVAVDGRRVSGAAAAIRAVRDHDPGQPVRLRLRRGGERLSVVVETVEGDEGVPQVGLELEDEVEFRFPFSVHIETGQVGGPSAGLAFGLAVIDELTPGELTGGKRVAVTGTLDRDGKVSAVGGVRQKAVAALRAGARLMLVPSREVDEARVAAGSMRVVGVGSLEDALRALGAAGGNTQALPPPPRR